LTTATSSNAPPRLAWARRIHLLLGCLLIAAALLKGYGAWRGEVPELQILRSAYVQLALIEAELILGFWLLSGIVPRLSHLAAVVANTGFLAAACYEVVLRARSCGCFGPVSVNPKVTVALDAVALLALLICWPGRRPNGGIRGPGQWLTLGAGCLLVLAAPLLVLRSKPDFDNRRVIFLEPDQWVGKTFRLQRYISGGDDLSQGKWLVILYRHDCPTCEVAMPSYLELAKRSSATHKRPARIAFVELPPYGAGEKHSPDAHWLTLPQNKEWAGQTPIVLLLQDGTVKAVLQGEAAEKPPASAENWID
jgi:hypothetical protein